MENVFGKREYFCPACNVNFFVIFQNEVRIGHCSYCGHEIHETGIVMKIEGDEIVTYHNEKETNRKKKNGL